MGAVIPISKEQYQKILPSISTGKGMVVVGDRTVNIKDIVCILPLIELDKEVLREQKMWRCKHGIIYHNWEQCTCSAYGGKYLTGCIQGQEFGILESEEMLKLGSGKEPENKNRIPMVLKKF